MFTESDHSYFRGNIKNSNELDKFYWQSFDETSSVLTLQNF